MLGNELDHPHRLGFDPFGGGKLVLRSLVGEPVRCAVGETEDECCSELAAGQASPSVYGTLDSAWIEM